jgi:hypothetical protein
MSGTRCSLVKMGAETYCEPLRVWDRLDAFGECLALAHNPLNIIDCLGHAPGFFRPIWGMFGSLNEHMRYTVKLQRLA